LTVRELVDAIKELASNGRGETPVVVQVGDELRPVRGVEVRAIRGSRLRPREVLVVLRTDESEKQ
jgi:hypothetical protein